MLTEQLERRRAAAMLELAGSAAPSVRPRPGRRTIPIERLIAEVGNELAAVVDAEVRRTDSRPAKDRPPKGRSMLGQAGQALLDELLGGLCVRTAESLASATRFPDQTERRKCVAQLATRLANHAQLQARLVDLVHETERHEAWRKANANHQVRRRPAMAAAPVAPPPATDCRRLEVRRDQAGNLLEVVGPPPPARSFTGTRHVEIRRDANGIVTGLTEHVA